MADWDQINPQVKKCDLPMLLSGEQTLRNGFFGIFEQNIRWPVARDKIVENLCIIISLLSIFKPKTIQKKNVLRMQSMKQLN